MCCYSDIFTIKRDVVFAQSVPLAVCVCAFEHITTQFNDHRQKQPDRTVKKFNCVLFPIFESRNYISANPIKTLDSDFMDTHFFENFRWMFRARDFFLVSIVCKGCYLGIGPNFSWFSLDLSIWQLVLRETVFIQICRKPKNKYFCIIHFNNHISQQNCNLNKALYLLLSCFLYIGYCIVHTNRYEYIYMCVWSPFNGAQRTTMMILNVCCANADLNPIHFINSIVNKNK